MLENELSRRQLLVRSAAAAAGLSLSMSMLAAQKAHAMIDPTPNPASDLATLLGLLAAEYNAIATYSAGAGLIATDTVTPKDVRDTVTAVAVHFQSQHKDHADALAKLINSTGGSAPAMDPNLKPSLPAQFAALITSTSQPSTTDVIKLACDKEKGAAIAYAGAMQTLSTTAAASLVAAIGGVETQHFVVLYLLAEGMVTATTAAGTSPQLVVPASFVLDLGLMNTTNLANFPALDTLLTLDPKAPA